MALSWDATYFDGKTAKSHEVKVRFETADITFSNSSGAELRWPYKKVEVEDLKNEIRITYRKEPDATLVILGSALQALTEQAPFLRAEKRRQRKFIGLVTGLTAAAAASAVFLFVIIPSLATSMARNTPIETEMQIGENLASQIQLFFPPCKNEEAHKLLAPIVQDFAKAGGIEYDVELTLVNTQIPNAFALPGGQMMATRGFINAVGDDQEAFWAVVAHELAHVKNRDGMVALYRNLGLSTLLEIITGGSGLAQQAVLVGGQLTDLSYTRGQEQAADDTAYEIMRAMNLNPAALGRALSALTSAIVSEEKDGSSDSSERNRFSEWLRTHPNTEKRIDRAKTQSENEGNPLPLSRAEWSSIQIACEVNIFNSE